MYTLNTLYPYPYKMENLINEFNILQYKMTGSVRSHVTYGFQFRRHPTAAGRFLLRTWCRVDGRRRGQRSSPTVRLRRSEDRPPDCPVVPAAVTSWPPCWPRIPAATTRPFRTRPRVAAAATMTVRLTRPRSLRRRSLSVPLRVVTRPCSVYVHRDRAGRLL